MHLELYALLLKIIKIQQDLIEIQNKLELSSIIKTNSQ